MGEPVVHGQEARRTALSTRTLVRLASIGFDQSLNLDKSLRLVGEIEDVELLRRIQARK